MTDHYINELIKCCHRYPRYHIGNGYVYVKCPQCDNMSRDFETRRQANVGWNQHREQQLKWGNWKLKEA